MEKTNCLNGCNGDMVLPNNMVYKVQKPPISRNVRQPAFIPPLPEPIILPQIIKWKQERQSGVTGYGLDAGSYDQTGMEISNDPLSIFSAGCYYVRMVPAALNTPPRCQFEGTIRIQNTGGSIIASGDLYKNNLCKTQSFFPVPAETNGGKTTIPIFPIKQYAYYLRITGIKSSGAGSEPCVLLEMESHQFNHSDNSWMWNNTLSVELRFSISPDGIRYWRGDLQTSSRVIMGHMAMVHISDYFRQAVVELDRVAAAELPLNNEQDEDWHDIYKKAGWYVTVDISNDDVVEPDDYSWSNAELHKAMVDYKEKVDLDKQWRYHLLAVRKLDEDDVFGVMYDNTIKDINGIPREGAAIACQAMFDQREFWGKCKGKSIGEFKNLYFRTAVHEIGHAMMLRHPESPYENHLMQKTLHIACNGTDDKPFPGNIQWSFSPKDVHLLCHLPDIAIRPGGISFGTPDQRLPVNAQDEVMEAEDLELTVTPTNEIVPIGAPVRINFTLTNKTDHVVTVPGSLRMKSGNITGRVIDPMGNGQEFATIIRYIRGTSEDDFPTELPEEESISHSATMLWGTDGPLFPMSGFYRIILEVNWNVDGSRMRIDGSAAVMITPPEDEEHARIALKIFSNPDVLLALAIGGDHLNNGNDIICRAMKHPVLKPHYELLEAKRVGQRFVDRSPVLEETLGIINEDTIMTPTEIVRMAKILMDFAAETAAGVVEKIARLLTEKARGTTAEKITEKRIAIALKAVKNKYNRED